MGDTIEWEGIEWTKEGDDTSTGLPFKCDGCGNQVHAAGLYSAVYPDGAKVHARWCADCIDTAKAGR